MRPYPGKWKLLRLFIFVYYTLFEFLENVAEVNFFADNAVEVLNLNALLLHCVTVTDGYATVVE